MEENRRKLAFLGIVGTIVLVAMIGYPIVKDIIREYRQREISLSQESAFQAEVDSVAEKMQEKESYKEEEKPFYGTEHSLTGAWEKGQQEIWLSVLGGSMEVKVSLWLSGDGTGYFFFPGFARGKELMLESLEGESLWLGDRQIREGDVFLDIQEEEAYQMRLVSKEGETLLQLPVLPDGSCQQAVCKA